MPKSKYKHVKDISRRHLNRLVQREVIHSFQTPSTSGQNENPSESEVEILPRDIDQSDDEIQDSFGENSDQYDERDMEYSSVEEGVTDGSDCEEQFDSESNTLEKFSDTEERHSSTGSQDYISKLANWAVKYQVKSNAVNALLDIQRQEPGYEYLPKDSRTLLNTPRSTVTRRVEPGEYYHFGLLNTLEIYIKSCGMSKPIRIDVFVGIDGLPISNSSKSQVWPILCFFKSNLKSKTSQVYTIGIYHGYEKPHCSNDFLNDFLLEITPLINEGYKDESSNLTISIRLAAIICDAPAKSFVFKTKGHTGFYSCSKCTQKGITQNGRTYFPETNSEKRTHGSFRSQSQKDYHSGFSNLVNIPNFDLVQCVPLDYMHLICLGVVKKLLHMWLYKVKGPHRLPNHVVQPISENLSELRSHIPMEFARKPRSLLESNRWKATELRQFLLYTGPVVLKSKLPEKLYLHFLSLSVAVSIMLSEKYHNKLLDYADSLLRWFVDSFSLIYGKQYISHNVHSLIHLKDDVLQFGTLDECSAFAFESFMFVMKKLLIRKPEKPLQQFARRQAELLRSQQVSVIDTTQSFPVFKHSHCDGPVVRNLSGEQYKEIVLKDFVLSTSLGNNCFKLKDDTIATFLNVVKNGESVTVIGKTFTKVQDFFTKPCPSSTLGILYVSNLSNCKQWDLSDVVQKCILLPLSNGFVVYPLLHCV